MEKGNTSAIYPAEMKTCVHTKTCMKMFIGILFVINENWKEPNVQLVNVLTVVHLYNRTYSAIKGKKLLINTIM